MNQLVEKQLMKGKIKMQKVIIIGAGPAGLTAAYELLKKGKYEVIILEKDLVVGGISKTVSIGNSYLVDTGIHRFFSKNDRVNEIWNEILPLQSKPAYDDIILQRKKQFAEVGSDPEKQEKSMLIKDRCTRIYYKKNFFDYPVTLKFENIKKLGLFTIIKAGFSYIKAKMIKKEETSLENFYINRFGKVLYSIFFENYTEKVWGVHPSKISADWGAQRVKGVSITEVLKNALKNAFNIKDKTKTETSLIDSFFYPKLGAGQMWEAMSEKIVSMGGKIITDAKVVEINLENNKVSKIVYEQKGVKNEIKLDILISSMPIKDLILSIKNKKIPNEIYKIAKDLPYRNFISVCMVTKKLNLKNETNIKTIGNIVPDDWIYIQEPDVKLGRIQIFNNWSPYLFKDKNELNQKVVLGLEYFCSDNDEYWNMSSDKFIDFAKEEAVKIGIIDSSDFITAKQIKIDKAYPAYFGAYKDIGKVTKYLDDISNLYCIGRNGQHRYNNMDHSMLTGIETAKCILKGNKEKAEIWKVNTEKEYHETKHLS